MAHPLTDPVQYLETAQKRAAEVAGLDMSAARQIRRIGVIGGGTMGQGIARACLAAGLQVIMMERDKEALTLAKNKIAELLESKVTRGRLSAQDRTARLTALTCTTQMSDLRPCDLVIEVVFEDMAVKKSVFAMLEQVLPPQAIIATNTSYLDIDQMASDLADPTRVIGLHFFGPADVMNLLEVVRTAHTSDPVLATGLALAGRLGKTPVISKVAEGFIGNRIYNAYRRRAELLVLDVAAPHEVDKAATDFGFAMGPFAVSDLSGLDIAWAMRKRQAPTRDPKARYVTIPDQLCEAGRLGRKTGAGWYDYPDRKPQPSPVVEALITKTRQTEGITPADVTPTDIQNQLLAAITNEAALLLDEGIAQRPSDIDVALTNGYGFPRAKGGPLHWAAQQDPALIQNHQDQLARAIGHGHRAGPVAQSLQRFQEEG